MTRLLSTWRGWLYAIFAAVLLTACDPIVDIVAPQETEVGMLVSFSTERLPQFKDSDFSELQYEWDFGDGAKASGPQASHAYAQPGDYEVILNVTDASLRSWGQAYTSRKIIKVAPYSGALVPVSVRVYDDKGRTVQDATVSMADQSALTDLAGGVLITPTKPELQPVVVIRKAGYLPQSVRVPDGQPAERGVIVTLKSEAPAVPIPDIAVAQTVAPSDANLSPVVSVPDQAFVNPRGEPVSGAASVRITPWDITSQADMAAFPGDAKADDGSGRVVSLVSFGMLSIEFEQNGEKLQLAPGKKAVISMHLPITHDVQGREIKVGDAIPLWHFNEVRGVWEQEGEGVVVASDLSWTGLAVRAEVGHFSTWNWDKIANPEVSPVTRQISCQIPDGQGGYKPLDAEDLCVIRIEQRRPNGQVLTDSLVVRGGGAVAFDRFVSDANVTIKAEALAAGYRGTASSTISVSDNGLPWHVELNEKLIINQTVGLVPVVPESEALIEFVAEGGLGYFEALYDQVKVFSQSPVDGTLTELAFPVYAELLSIETVSIESGATRYRYSIHGGGNALGQDAQGRFAGQFVAKLPVQRDYVTNSDGVSNPTRTDLIEAPFTVASQAYGSGPVAIQVRNKGIAFALWDEVGVSSPIRADSVVEFRYRVIDDGWVSEGMGPWKRAVIPFAFGGPASAQTDAMNQGPYFMIQYDCEDLQLDVFGTHRFTGQVRVTDPTSNTIRIYDLQPFVATVPRPPCT